MVVSINNKESCQRCCKPDGNKSGENAATRTKARRGGYIDGTMAFDVALQLQYIATVRLNVH